MHYNWRSKLLPLNNYYRVYSQWCCQSRNNWVKKPYQTFLIPIFPNQAQLFFFSSTQAQFCTNPIQPNSPLGLNVYIYFISWANKIHKSPTSYPNVHFTNSHIKTPKNPISFPFQRSIPIFPNLSPTLFFVFFSSCLQPRLNFVQTQFKPNSPLGLNKPLFYFMGQQNQHLDMVFIRVGCEKLTLINLSVKDII